ncbi:ABC transporter ATP-binding protein [Facklamia sp. 7083-14-GEN3]|uniref:ATP-binding cassette domain-containing protein n=1 Tax=Facklamia sp. 7083-14-GEN3 TaxID=2973478 RepID=UPI00215BB15E|nr:ABC transporter ATP-binding protein [Facklamia sp. 7083-14-GEN3]MCR8969801.1 ABC transporter ATP-binding protein/permease [Facklamia sp. 7083-14-GEN3]
MKSRKGEVIALEDRINTLKFLVNRLWQFDKRFFFYYFLDIVLKIFTPLYQLFVSVHLISLLMKETSLLLFSKQVFILIVGLIFLESLKTVLMTTLEKHNDIFRINVINDVLIQRINLDYPLLIGSDAASLYDNASNALGNKEEALIGILSNFAEVMIALLSVLIYANVLSQLSVIFILLLILMVGGLLVIKHFQNKLLQKNRPLHAINSTKFNYLNYTMGDQRVAKDVRLYSMSTWFKDIFDQLWLEYETIVRPENQWKRIEGFFVVLMLVIMMGVAYQQSVVEIRANQMEPQNFLIYATMVTMMASNITTFINTSANFFLQNEKLISLYRYFNQKPVFNHQNKEAIPQKIETIEFRNVTYTYPNADKPTINQFNLRIKKNEKLAIVGENGAGKTTLIKLLLGLLKPDQGEILINGINTREFKIEDYYRLFAPVFQDNYLFTFTVKDTILQGYAFDLKRYKHVLDQSGLKKVIDQLPQGDQTSIVREVDNQGVHLSGGQLQKLKLAQALYKNAPVLVLDEPTAALDPISESEVYQNYLKFSKDKIALFISHRLASTQFCDRIIYLGKGQVVEEGSHVDLMKKEGAYYQMFATQAYYYREHLDEERKSEEMIEQGGLI